MWWAAIPAIASAAKTLMDKDKQQPVAAAPTPGGMPDLGGQKPPETFWTPQTPTPPPVFRQPPAPQLTGLFAGHSAFTGAPMQVGTAPGPLGERPYQPETWLTPEVKAEPIRREQTPYEKQISEQEQERYKRLIDKTGGWWD